ncbi:MAG: ABC transporter permease [Legionellaceae bacterium]|nr:ABC transporter permease [Legionellaceae bacterium]|tara:strand:+ start:126 stop:893 length:768 start_codon:yes stop_codon:yes gene_type:complete
MNLQLIAYYTLVRKEISRIFRIWIQTLFPPIITSTLYFIIFGRIIGSRIGMTHGVSYIDYIAPGIIMMQMIMAAYGNATSTVFGAKFARHIEEILVSPMSYHTIILAYTSAAILRGLIVGLGVTIIVEFFTHLAIKHILLMLFVAVMTTALFSLLGFINGIYARKFDDISFIPSFVLTPLTYLGGVFYSISALPWFWQKISLFNPIVYTINCFRFSILNISDVSISSALTAIMLFTAVLYLICFMLLKKGIGTRN